jgi:hypothetical protein
MKANRATIAMAGTVLAACNGFELDESQFQNQFFDGDGDGVSRFVVDGQAADCDDTNPEIFPLQMEICDGIDNNCDDRIDTAPDAAALNGLTGHYADTDGDGFGDPRSTLVRACEQPSGYVTNPDDCDDFSADVNPERVEVCDGVDNDCNAISDDVQSEDGAFIYYRDADADGYGAADDTQISCDLTAPAGYAENDGDCNDTNPYIHPGDGTVEVSGDGVDQNCDGEDDCMDLDCDGRADVVMGWCDSSDLPWFDVGESEVELGLSVLMSSDNTAHSFGEEAATTALWTGDLDGDGYKDVIRAIGDRGSSASGGIYAEVHRGPFDSEHVDFIPDEAERVRYLQACGGTAIAVGDFDGNGSKDVVVGGPESCGSGPEKTAVFMNPAALLGNGEAYVSRSSAFSTNVVHALLAVDLNGDGYDDLVVCHGPDPDELESVAGGLFMVGGSADGLVGSPVDLGLPSCADVAVGEVSGNDDRYNDLVIVQGYDDAATWLAPVVVEIAEDGSPGALEELAVFDAHTVQVVDLDSDGDDDLLFGTGRTPSIPLEDDTSDAWNTPLQVLVNDAGTLSALADVDLASQGGMFPLVALFDDADDRLDIVAPGHDNDAGTDRATISHVQSEGALGFAGGVSLALPEWVHGTPFDYNRDGHMDVLAMGAPESGGLILISGSANGLTEASEVLVSGPTSSVAPLIVE